MSLDLVKYTKEKYSLFMGHGGIRAHLYSKGQRGVVSWHERVATRVGGVDRLYQAKGYVSDHGLKQMARGTPKGIEMLVDRLSMWQGRESKLSCGGFLQLLFNNQCLMSAPL